MWELRTEDGPRVLRTIKTLEPVRCKICGQYLLPGDEYYLIVCNAIPEARAEKMQNMMVHTNCWDEFCKGEYTDASLAAKLKRHKTPKAGSLTEEQCKFVDAFVSAAGFYQYHILSNTKNGCIKATKRGTTCAFVYNPYSQTIRYEDRRKGHLFKGLFDRQAETNLYNKMHEILGDGKHDDYSALGTIEKAIEETNKFFQKQQNEI